MWPSYIDLTVLYMAILIGNTAWTKLLKSAFKQLSDLLQVLNSYLLVCNGSSSFFFFLAQELIIVKTNMVKG